MSEKIVTIGKQQTEIAVERDGATLRAGEHVLEIVAIRDEEIEVLVAGRLHIVPFVVDGATISFSFDGEIYFAEVAEKGARVRARHRDHSTSAPMPGQVLKILVRAGDVVRKGTPLLILEAMKMEHPILAGRDGTISAVNCSEGELVQPGIELVTMEDNPA